MLNIQTIRNYRCDLSEGPCEITLKSPLMHQDALGDVFRVAVWRSGTPVDLTGLTVLGYLYFAATRQTMLLPGSVSEHYASVPIMAGGYDIPGYASLVVQLQQGDVRHTILKVNFCIERTGSDAVIDPADMVPTLPELLNQIAVMKETTAEAHQTIAAVKSDASAAVSEAYAAAAETRQSALDMAQTAGPAIVAAASGALVTASDAAARPAVSVITRIEPAQQGSGEASPTNVRPFKTFDSVTLNITDKNLLGGMHMAEILWDTAAGVIDASAGTVRYNAGNLLHSPALIRGNVFKPGQVYTVVLYGRNTNANYQSTNIAVSYTDGTYMPIAFPVSGADAYAVFHSAAGKTVSSVFAISAAGETILHYDKCGVFEGALTVNAFSPYQGKRFSVNLPETLYGLDLDWTTGKVYKRYHRIVFDGVTIGAKVDATDPGYTTYAYIYDWNMPKPIKNGGRAYTNKIKSASMNTVLAFGLPKELTGVTDTDNATTVVSKYNALLRQWYDAGTPLEIVYEVATPEEIQLTPQQIDMLKGMNNVWSSAGETELAYIADTKMYIDQRISALLNL